MTIFTDIEQGTAEWFQIRAGKVTASELHNLLTPKFKIRDGETPKTYLFKKVAEAFLGKPTDDEDFSNWHTENGQMLEYEARRFYKFNYDAPKLTDAGFVLHDDGRFGCSPDALVGEDSGLELKCPAAKTHVKYLINGELPDDYVTQVHGEIYATGRASWDFMSYARKFPPFLIHIERDEEICAKIQEALAQFYQRFDEALAKLKIA